MKLFFTFIFFISHFLHSAISTDSFHIVVSKITSVDDVKKTFEKEVPDSLEQALLLVKKYIAIRSKRVNELNTADLRIEATGISQSLNIDNLSVAQRYCMKNFDDAFKILTDIQKILKDESSCKKHNPIKFSVLISVISTLQSALVKKTNSDDFKPNQESMANIHNAFKAMSPALDFILASDQYNITAEILDQLFKTYRLGDCLNSRLFDKNNMPKGNRSYILSDLILADTMVTKFREGLDDFRGKSQNYDVVRTKIISLQSSISFYRKFFGGIEGNGSREKSYFLGGFFLGGIMNTASAKLGSWFYAKGKENAGKST